MREPAPLEAARDVLPRFSQLVTIHGRSTLVTREPVSGEGYLQRPLLLQFWPLGQSRSRRHSGQSRPASVLMHLSLF
jgi:hypothetical protein